MPVEKEMFAIHPRAGMMFVTHTPSFSTIDRVINCGTFTNGSGNSMYAGITIEVPVNKAWYIGLGIASVNRGGELLNDGFTEPARNVDLSLTNVLTRNVLAVELPYIDIQPEVRYHFLSFGRINLRGFAAFRASFPLSSTYSQRQEIASPDNAVFRDNQQSTISILPSSPLSAVVAPAYGINIGLENLLPVSSRMFFTQQVGFDYMLNSVVQNQSWGIRGLHASLGLRYSILQSEEEMIPPPPPIENKKKEIVEIPKPLPLITVEMSKTEAVLQTGNELRASLPLVNAIFFDQQSESIPQRYITSTNDAVDDKDAVAYHRGILRMITTIMQSNPKASIILEGAVSSDETGGTNLARKRAEAVLIALDNLGVDRTRMTVKALNTPRISSNQDFAQGREENRRVDITVLNAPLQEYVNRENYYEVRGSTTFNVVAQNLDPKDKISLSGSLIQPESFDVKDSVTTIEKRLSFVKRVPSATGTLTNNILAQGPSTLNARGDTDIDITSLKREQVELNIENFLAVLRFDYNSSTLTTENKELLKQLVNVLPNGSTIEILGSADVLGSDTRNKELSEQRAKETEDYIRSISKKQLTITSSGITTEKFDDGKPEGRFLNRSIRIRLK